MSCSNGSGDWHQWGVSEEQPHPLSPGHLQIASAGDCGGDSVHRGVTVSMEGGQSQRVTGPPSLKLSRKRNGKSSLRLPVFWEHTEQLQKKLISEKHQ